MNSLLYRLDRFSNVGKIGSGSSNPDRYTNCTDYQKKSTCEYYTQKKCQSFIVKLGIGSDHEFIDTVLASLFLNSFNISGTALFPHNGYKVSNNAIVGGVSLELCEFETIKDIFKKHDKDYNGEVNVRKTSIGAQNYLEELNYYLNNTDPKSIILYYILQFISGGGDPNPGNIGFAKNPDSTSKYPYVFAKIDLGASFKEYNATIKGNIPTLESNLYAFDIPNDIKSLSDLYNYIIKNGRIFMPGEAYSSKKPGNTEPTSHFKTEAARQKAKKILALFPRDVLGLPPSQYASLYSGRSDTGFYDQQYPGGITGISAKNYISESVFQNTLQEFCSSMPLNTVTSIFSESNLTYIQDLQSTSNSVRILALLQTEDSQIYPYNNYTHQIIDLISKRHNRICSFIKPEYQLSSNTEESILNAGGNSIPEIEALNNILKSATKESSEHTEECCIGLKLLYGSIGVAMLYVLGAVAPVHPLNWD